MTCTSPPLRFERLDDRITPAATPLAFNVSSGNSTWQLKNTCTAGGLFGAGQSGFGILDGRINSPFTVDAYDDAFLIGVNGTLYKDADGLVDLTGTTVTSDTATLSGLTTWVEFYFSPSTSTVRAVYSFSNSTGSAISAQIQWANNLGSDSSTKIENTSNGNTMLDASDRWLITSDDGNGDPIVTWVRFGSGSVLTPSATLKTPGPGADTYEEQFALTIGAGATRRLMFFGQLHTDVTSATTDAATFSDSAALINSGLLSGMSNQSLAEILNWNFAPDATLTASNVTDNTINASSVSNYAFAVTYASPANINVSTLDNTDVRVTGPNGFDVLATFDSATPASNATSVVATYHITPPGGKWNVTDNGLYTLTSQANSVQNVLGASFAQKTLGTINVDMHAPTVTVNQSVGQSDPATTSPINFTVVFSEAVTGFDSTDVVIGGTAGATTAQVSGSGTTYTVSISGMNQSGTVTASVKAGGAVDLSNDANIASTSTDNSIQFSTSPHASLTAGDVTDAGVNASTVGAYSFTITYTNSSNIDVKTLDNADIRVTGPNGFDVLATFDSANPAGNATSVIATYHITPPGGKWNIADNGVYTFTSQANSVQNVLGAGVAQKNLGTINVDMHAPTVTINQSASQSDPTATSPIKFTVLFSESVTGFDPTDVVIGGTAGATTAQVTGSGTTYTVSIAGMTQGGTVTADVKAGAAVDLSNDGNAASTSTDNIVQFSGGPQASLSASGVTDSNVDAVTVAKYTFTVNYTDVDGVDVSTLGNDEIRVTGPNGFDVLAAFDSASPPTNSTSVVATYHVTPAGGKWNVTDNGSYTFTVQSNAVQNVVGAGVAQKSLGTINVDLHAPTATINQSVGQSDPTGDSPINFTVVFSESVTGFDPTDVAIGGTAGATTAQISGGGTTYTVSISGMTQSGTVTAGVKSGAAVDISNDANTASTSTDNSVQFSSGPQATLTASDVNDAGVNATTVAKYTFTVTYFDPDSIDVTFLGDNDVRVTGPNGFDALATFDSATPANNATSVVATYHITPPEGKWNGTDNGLYTITSQANSVQNVLGVGYAQKTLGMINVDMHAPTVTINQSVGQADPTVTSPINFTVVFSEAVTGFDLADVAIGGTAGATTAQVIGSGTTYTVSISGMTQSGTVTAGVKAGGAVDLSNDANAASTSADNSIQFVTNPQATLTAADVTDASVNATTVAAYAFTVTYTNAANLSVSTLDNADIRVTGPNGFDSFATFDSATPASNATSVVATYHITPPGGKWNVIDNGLYTFTSQANSVQNVLGAGVTQKSLGTINVDMHAPTVTINQSASQSDPTATSPVTFTVVFSEAVTVFDATDVVIGGTAGATTAQVSGSGTTYTVSISGMTQIGTVTASVKTGAAIDLSDDDSAASTSSDNQVTTGSHIVLYATAADTGGGPHVKVFEADGTLRFSFFAYDPGFTGGVRVATADVTGDGIDDIITAAGPGGGPHIRVFNGATGLLQNEWYAYISSFSGGVYVGAADIDGDGKKDVITGAGPGGGPHVRVFSAATGDVMQEFYAYAASFSGGVRVAGGDVNDDSYDDVITGAGPGGGPHVMAFSGKTGAVLQSLFAYDPADTGGVFVAAGDINHDGKADIVTGNGTGNGQVNAFSGADGSLLQSFLAFEYGSGGGRSYGGFSFGGGTVNSGGGARVAVHDINGDGFDDIIAGAGPNGGPHIQIFNGQTQVNLRSFFAYDPSFTGGVYVG